MKIKLKPWDEVVRIGEIEQCYVNRFDCVNGLDRNSLPWGELVDSDIPDEDGWYWIEYDGRKHYIPRWMVEGADDDILQYGEVITDDEIYSPNIRIRLISYGGMIWYHKMRNGDVVEFRKVGKADGV